MRAIIFALIFIFGVVGMQKLGIEYDAAYAFFGYFVGIAHATFVFRGE